MRLQRHTHAHIHIHTKRDRITDRQTDRLIKGTLRQRRGRDRPRGAKERIPGAHLAVLLVGGVYPGQSVLHVSGRNLVIRRPCHTTH